LAAQLVGLQALVAARSHVPKVLVLLPPTGRWPRANGWASAWYAWHGLKPERAGRQNPPVNKLVMVAVVRIPTAVHGQNHPETCCSTGGRVKRCFPTAC